ncbi:hypothetical protein [Aequorivita lipolytica]|uniref:Uncharacterized protein n=1 Tax=Aequorivita lipolytica TaxID=153267 RepID=A0A5C6YLM6_9FLAO|nr:hypothetical protein [Aequorivita lipolytica]TXD68142.1 hypothetical protein ESV24_13535 [Aequorivita lipolytica]SRX53570.1 hypothetical protein AEQU2_02802 [Aequorivita lipolytica]
MLLTSLIKPILYFTLSMTPTQSINLDNKIIPESIKKEVIEALSFYPELYDTAIEFKFKDNIKKSTMQAQPRFASFFKAKENREYVILISRKIQIEGEEFTMSDIPSDVKIGWIGHELGHVMDYRERTNMGMLIFGLKYLFSPVHFKEVERAADTYAVAHGMGDYILKTKNFILENAHLSEKYKNRIRRLYISPEEVMELINKNKVEEEPEILEMND